MPITKDTTLMTKIMDIVPDVVGKIAKKKKES